MDLGCHMISLLRWYFGNIRQITSRLEHRFSLDLEDGALCFVKFLSGTRAVINVGWFSQAYQLRVELSGTVGHAVAQDPPSNPFSGMLHYLARGTSSFKWPYYVELQYFVNCLIRDEPPFPSLEDGLKDIEAISLAYKNQVF
jgi:predicted dehydrogenase